MWFLYFALAGTIRAALRPAQIEQATHQSNNHPGAKVTFNHASREVSKTVSAAMAALGLCSPVSMSSNSTKPVMAVRR